MSCCKKRIQKYIQATTIFISRERFNIRNNFLSVERKGDGGNVYKKMHKSLAEYFRLFAHNSLRCFGNFFNMLKKSINISITCKL